MNQRLEDFFYQRPNMKNNYSFQGNYDEYSSKIINNIPKIYDNGFLLKEIFLEIQNILNDKINIENFRKHFFEYPILSYADHHGLLNYPLLCNSNILFSEIVKKIKGSNILVFSTGRISLNNSSYPKGFYFKGRKFNFFRSNISSNPVYLLKEKINVDKNNGIDSFILNIKENNLTLEEKKFLNCLFFEYLEIDKFINHFNYFTEQITFLNFKLWKLYFDSSIRNIIPDILYIESNKIIANYIIKKLKYSDSLFNDIFFDSNKRNIFINNFHGIQGCWGDNFGSHFFWGVSKNNNLIKLRYEENSNKLIGNSFEINFEKESIINGLENKELISTIFLDYLIVTFIENITTLGGFNQLEYLPQMQEAHVKSLKEIGMNDLAFEFGSRVTDGLICGLTPFEHDSGIDLMWHYNSTNGKFNGNLDRGITEEELEKVRQMKMKDLILKGIDKMIENINA